MNRSDKIYVAGHTGLVGSAVVTELKEKGYRNIVLRSHRELDLRNQAMMELFFQEEQPEYVILAAAKVGGILANSRRGADFLYDNLMIAANVMNCSWKYGVKKLLNLGSSCIYPRNAEQPIREEALLTGSLEPTNEPYAVAKIAGIKLCHTMHEQYECDFFSVMPPNLYGPNDRFDLTASHVLPAMIRKFHLGKLLLEGQTERMERDLKHWNERQEGFSAEEQLRNFGMERDRITFWGTGKVFREFLYVNDLAKALVLLMETCRAEEVGEILNVGSGEEISICDLAMRISEIVGYRGEIHWDETHPDGTPRKLMDSSRIKNMIHWKPEISLETGIEQTYHWYVHTGAKS